MRHDYKVRSRGRDQIAETALRARQRASCGRQWTFNVATYVEEVLVRQLSGGLHLSLFDKQDGEPPARVTFGPTTLHVDRGIWNLAKFHNQPYARFVIAHEIGHLLLHRDQAMAFSDQLRAKPTYYPDHQSSEWQASVFALHFLLPRYMVIELREVDAIVELCHVPEELASEALAEAKDSRRRESLGKYEGDFCRECANFTLVRNGTCLKCDTCGSTTGCS